MHEGCQATSMRGRLSGIACYVVQENSESTPCMPAVIRAKLGSMQFARTEEPNATTAA